MLALALLQAGLMYSLMTGVQALRCKVVKTTTTNNTAAPPIAADTATHTLAPLSHPAMWSVTYDDRFSDTESNIITDVTQIEGYNTYIMGFYTTYAPRKVVPDAIGGPMDSLESWTNMTKAERQSIRNKYHAAGISLTFTTFGSLDDKNDWTMSNFNATAFGKELAEFVIAYDLDGVDLDWEDLDYADAHPVEASAMLATVTNSIRANLPRPYLVSHSVQAKWFKIGSIYSNVTTSVPTLADSAIDFYTDMFYWSPGSYDTCNSLLHQSVGRYSGSSLGEAAAGGVVAASKLLVGLPQAYADGDCKMSDGIGTALGTCLNGANYGGVAVWKYMPQYPDYIGNLRRAAGF